MSADALTLDLGTLPKGELRRVMTAEDATDLIGTTVPTLPPTRALREGGLWHDADTGEAVLGIYPCEELPTFRKAILSVQDTMKPGSTLRATGARNTSVTFGYRPRKPMMSQEGCVLTAFNRDYPNVAAFLAHYSEVLAEQVAQTFPEVEAAAKEAVQEVLPDWRLSASSAWTSGVINRESSLPYHRDGNNFEAWSVMPVIRRAVTGGHLHIPEYDITVPCRDGYAVAFFGKRLVHGVTPMKKTAPDGYRISVVYYALQGLKDCHTFAEETAYAARRRAEREDALGANGFKGTRILTADTRPSPGSADRRGSWANPTPVPES